MTGNDRGGGGGSEGGGGGGRMEGRLQLPGLALRQAGIQIVLNFLRKIQITRLRQKQDEESKNDL